MVAKLHSLYIFTGPQRQSQSKNKNTFATFSVPEFRDFSITLWFCSGRRRRYYLRHFARRVVSWWRLSSPSPGTFLPWSSPLPGTFQRPVKILWANINIRVHNLKTYQNLIPSSSSATLRYHHYKFLTSLLKTVLITNRRILPWMCNEKSLTNENARTKKQY